MLGLRLGGLALRGRHCRSRHAPGDAQKVQSSLELNGRTFAFERRGAGRASPTSAAPPARSTTRRPGPGAGRSAACRRSAPMPAICSQSTSSKSAGSATTTRSSRRPSTSLSPTPRRRGTGSLPGSAPVGTSPFALTIMRRPRPCGPGSLALQPDDPQSMMQPGAGARRPERCGRARSSSSAGTRRPSRRAVAGSLVSAMAVHRLQCPYARPGQGRCACAGRCLSDPVQLARRARRLSPAARRRRKRAEIDLLQLMRTAGALIRPAEYLRLAQLLLHAGSAVEAKAVLEEGVSRGVVNRSEAPTPAIAAEIDRAISRAPASPRPGRSQPTAGPALWR